VARRGGVGRAPYTAEVGADLGTSEVAAASDSARTDPGEAEAERGKEPAPAD